MPRTWGWSLLKSLAKPAPHRGRPRHVPERRFRPRLEQLEKRECPTVNLSVGTNLNLSRAIDNQVNETVAIDPTNSQHIFVASSTWHGSYEGGTGSASLFASYSRDGGATWTSRLMATGVDGGDSLPGGIGEPHAAFDSFGNLFVVYAMSHNEYLGTSTSVGATTLTDTAANWAPNEFANQQIKITSGADVNDIESIVSNTATTLTVASPWLVAPDAQSDFLISPPGSVNTQPVLASSSDGGQTFTWLNTWGLDTGPSAPFAPLVATGPGSSPGQGSVWALWYDGSGKPAVSGAPVTGLGQVGSFITPESPSIAPGYLASTGLAVGPGGQVLITWQTDLQNMPPLPPRAKIYTAVDSDGLGPNGFSTPVVATTSYLGLSYTSVPAMGNSSINAGAALAYDRSGGTHNGRAYLVYTDAANSGSSDTNVFAIHSDNDGATWSSPVQVNDDTTTNSQFLPSAAVDQTTGYLAVTWYDARNDPGNVLVRLYGTASADGGGSFAANVPISAGQTNGTLAGTESQGTAASVSATTLSDPSQHWTTDWWATPPNAQRGTFIVQVRSGPYTGDRAIIVGNTANTLTVDSTTWSSGPPSDSNVQYIIEFPYGGSVGRYTGLDYRAGKFFATWADSSNSTLDNPDYQEHTLDIYIAPVTVTVSPGGAGPAARVPAGQQSSAAPTDPVAPAALGAPSAGRALSSAPGGAFSLPGSPFLPASPALTPGVGGQGFGSLPSEAPSWRVPRPSSGPAADGRRQEIGIEQGQDGSLDLWAV